jgi:acetolactate synthase-1/2/3 large subunit
MQTTDTSTTTVVAALAEMLGRLGVRQAFGVSGGAMAALWDAMSASALGVHHFRHESGAMFAAIEAGFATGRPVVVFTTTGPGLTNALTGVLAAREERARVIVVSAYTSPAVRGRFPIQESTRDTLPASLYEAGRLFHFACVVEDAARLETLEAELARDLASPCGFVAHVALDTAAQRAPVALLASAAPAPAPAPASAPASAPAAPAPAPAAPAPAASAAPAPAPAALAPQPHELAACVAALRDGPFAIWVGFGARDAALEVAALARLRQAPVMASPRGKGIFPEDDPLYVGVTGLAGHASVTRYLDEHRPHRILVLGSRLGESTSFWDRRFVTPGGFVHVDHDPAVPGTAYPEAQTLAVVADVGATLRAVLAALPACVNGGPAPALPRPAIERVVPRRDGLVRPEALMDALQRWVVDSNAAPVLAESGNSFLWTTHRLRFSRPHRHRLSTNIGAMGHFAAGVVGVALATGRRAVAVVGDGAMLMTNEINTAVKFGAPATWIVLNDGRYGMCAQGMTSLGLSADATFPQVDFASFARAQGAQARRVDGELELDDAFDEAMSAEGPFVVDVRIDPLCDAPASRRNAALAGGHSTGVERTFPLAPHGNGV